jgi:hypothetical protein
MEITKMIRANIGLSRKLSKDYNSTGFSVNLEGEILAPVSDAEAVIDQVRRLFNLGEEILEREIEAHQGDTAIATRDGANGYVGRPKSANGNHRPQGETTSSTDRTESGGIQSATEKQVAYLLSLSKRNRLSTLELDQRISGVLGRSANVYQLSKQEAARVIDTLAGAEKGNKS